MCSESGGSENSFTSDLWIEERILKAITYSDEKLLKNSLKIYKREKKEINDGLVLEHAVRLAKSKELKMLIKAGIDPSSLNNRGLSALDQCLIEMAPLCGSEIDEWLEIAVFLSKRIVSRTKFTTKLLSLQRDPKVSSQLLKLVASPPLLLTTCLHSLRRSNIPALLESRFLIRKADRGSDDEVEFNSSFIQEINRKQRKRRRRDSLKNWDLFTGALAAREKISPFFDFIELPSHAKRMH